MTRLFKLHVLVIISLALVACATIRVQPMEKLSGLWVVEDISRRGIIDNSHLTLAFLPGGRLAGNTGCNPIKTSYQIKGNRIRLGPVVQSRTGCGPALLNQQTAFLLALSEVHSYRIDQTGALVLESGDGRSILARRP